jgi:predicted MFS family arabinose efflux permease
VTAIAAATFLLVATEFLPIGLLPPFAADFFVSEEVTDLCVTVPGLLAAIASPLLAGRVDRRVVLVVLTMAIILSNIIAAIAPSLSIFLAARFILGLSVGRLWSLFIAVGCRLVPKRGGARVKTVVGAGAAFDMSPGETLDGIIVESVIVGTVFEASCAVAIVQAAVNLII